LAQVVGSTLYAQGLCVSVRSGMAKRCRQLRPVLT